MVKIAKNKANMYLELFKRPIPAKEVSAENKNNLFITFPGFCNNKILIKKAIRFENPIIREY